MAARSSTVRLKTEMLSSSLGGRNQKTGNWKLSMKKCSYQRQNELFGIPKGFRTFPESDRQPNGTTTRRGLVRTADVNLSVWEVFILSLLLHIISLQSKLYSCWSYLTATTKTSCMNGRGYMWCKITAHRGLGSWKGLSLLHHLPKVLYSRPNLDLHS